MGDHGVSRTVVGVLVAVVGLAATPELLAGWGFAATWDIAERWGELEQTADSGLTLFDMAGEYPACALGLDDDCDGFLDGGFFFGEVEKAGELLSTLPTEEIALGGVLTKKGWSGLTIIDLDTWQDMLLLSYGEPPAGLVITAPMVMDISQPAAMDKASPKLFESCGLLLALSQKAVVRYEWDFDSDGVLDRQGYWGQNGPVFLGPGIPPWGGRSSLTVTDNNVPAKTTTYYVGGSPPETLRPGDIIVPNSNMGFKLNLVAIESPGPGAGGALFSNMGFKLNYCLWQGGESDPPAGDWWGHCNAWATSTWALVPQPDSVAKKIVGICLSSAIAAFDGRLSMESEVSGSDVLPLEEVSFNYAGGGKMALFMASRGWFCDAASEAGGAELFAQSARIDGACQAAVVLVEGQSWSIELKKDDKAPGEPTGEEDIVFLTPRIAGERFIAATSTANFAAGAVDATWQWNWETNEWESLLADAEAKGSLFIRGEVNLDSLESPDISDAVFILQWLFSGGREPLCLDAADVNDDSATDISDAIGLLSFLFSGGKAPASPFPGAGPDPTPDSIGCDLMR